MHIYIQVYSQRMILFKPLNVILLDVFSGTFGFFHLLIGEKSKFNLRIFIIKEFRLLFKSHSLWVSLYRGDSIYLCKWGSSSLDCNFALIIYCCPNVDCFSWNVSPSVQSDPTRDRSRRHTRDPQLVFYLTMERLLKYYK